MSDIEMIEACVAPELEREPDVRPADVRRVAMDLLARREHSRRELREKLVKRFGDEPLLDEQLDLLAEENLQCDQRYADSLLRQRISRGHGPVRIRQEMRQKGVGNAEIEAAMMAEDVDWYARAEATYHRKFGVIPPVDIKDKSKRMRFMQYRGFDVEHYRHLLED
ncbi:MAG: regulatory protein RecX [Halioglobus sp.]